MLSSLKVPVMLVFKIFVKTSKDILKISSKSISTRMSVQILLAQIVKQIRNLSKQSMEKTFHAQIQF